MKSMLWYVLSSSRLNGDTYKVGYSASCPDVKMVPCASGCDTKDCEKKTQFHFYFRFEQKRCTMVNQVYHWPTTTLTISYTKLLHFKHLSQHFNHLVFFCIFVNKHSHSFSKGICNLLTVSEADLCNALASGACLLL